MEQLEKIILLVLNNSSLSYDQEIKADTHLREDFGFDSLALAELAVRIEDIFDIDVFEDGLVSTVGEIMDKLGL
jgi:acyl carrier protein